MIYRLVILSLTLLWLAAPARAQVPEQVSGLVTHGTDRGQFLAVVAPVEKSDGSMLPQTDVRFRPLGGGPEAWAKYAAFDARVLCLAERGGDLAVLLQTGDEGPGHTQLRFIYNSLEPDSRAEDVPGPSVPAGLTLLDIAGGAADTSLLALASNPETHARLLALGGRNWRFLPALPPSVAEVPPAQMDLGNVGGAAVLAIRTAPDQLTVLRHNPDAATAAQREASATRPSTTPAILPGSWEQVGALAVAPDERFLVVSGQELVSTLVYIFGGTQERVVRLDGPTPEVTPITFEMPEKLRLAPTADDPRAAAVALGSIRLERAVAREQGENGETGTVLLELALDPQTLEPRGAPIVLNFVALSAEEVRQQVVTMLLYGLLVVAVVTVLRQKPLPAPEQLRDVAGQLAPFGLRAAAGLIDCLPLVFVAGLYTVSQERLGEPALYMLAGAGFTVYFGHLIAAEALTGRSLGKAVFGLKVVSVDGGRAGVWAVVLRNILRPLDAATLGLGLALINPLRQRLGDMAAATTVIQTRREETP